MLLQRANGAKLQNKVRLPETSLVKLTKPNLHIYVPFYYLYPSKIILHCKRLKTSKGGIPDSYLVKIIKMAILSIMNY